MNTIVLKRLRSSWCWYSAHRVFCSVCGFLFGWSWRIKALWRIASFSCSVLNGLKARGFRTFSVRVFPQVKAAGLRELEFIGGEGDLCIAASLRCGHTTPISKKRLTAFAEKRPQCCRQTDDDKYVRTWDILNEFGSACGLRPLFLPPDATSKRIHESYLDLKINRNRVLMTKVMTISALFWKVFVKGARLLPL